MMKEIPFYVHSTIAAKVTFLLKKIETKVLNSAICKIETEY